MERHRQKEFPNPFDEDLERKLWVPRRDRIFVPSNHVVRLSYDIETPAKGTLLYTLDWDAVIAQLNAETRREVRDRGICDDCMGGYGGRYSEYIAQNIEHDARPRAVSRNPMPPWYNQTRDW